MVDQIAFQDVEKLSHAAVADLIGSVFGNIPLRVYICINKDAFTYISGKSLLGSC